MNQPLISVIMPVFNAEKYVRDAIESVLQQDFDNFEFIIINDGSTDNSEAIIKSFDDKRIVFISRENKGIVSSLNEGVRLAKGKYIARMDADDISLPYRFSKQLEFMQENHLDVCGSGIDVFGVNDFGEIEVYYSIKNPSDNPLIKCMLCLGCYFAHPTIMAKSEVLKQNPYPDITCEDYALWCELALKNFKMGNTEQILLKYRVHNHQLSKVKMEKMETDSNLIGSAYASKMFPNFPLLKRAQTIINKNDFVLTFRLLRQLNRALLAMGGVENIRFFL